MAIDYSRPGYEEMFASYGRTALAAQALEKTVLVLLAGVECLEASKVSKDTYTRSSTSIIVRHLVAL